MRQIVLLVLATCCGIAQGAFARSVLRTLSRKYPPHGVGPQSRALSRRGFYHLPSSPNPPPGSGKPPSFAKMALYATAVATVVTAGRLHFANDDEKNEIVDAVHRVCGWPANLKKTNPDGDKIVAPVFGTLRSSSKYADDDTGGERGQTTVEVESPDSVSSRNIWYRQGFSSFSCVVLDFFDKVLANDGILKHPKPDGAVVFPQFGTFGGSTDANSSDDAQTTVEVESVSFVFPQFEAPGLRVQVPPLHILTDMYATVGSTKPSASTADHTDGDGVQTTDQGESQTTAEVESVSRANIFYGKRIGHFFNLRTTKKEKAVVFPQFGTFASPTDDNGGGDSQTTAEAESTDKASSTKVVAARPFYPPMAK